MTGPVRERRYDLDWLRVIALPWGPPFLLTRIAGASPSGFRTGKLPRAS